VVPRSASSVEVVLLAPLPSLLPSNGRREPRKVDMLLPVRFASARYSVPDPMLGQRVSDRRLGRFDRTRHGRRGDR